MGSKKRTNPVPVMSMVVDQKDLIKRLYEYIAQQEDRIETLELEIQCLEIYIGEEV